MIPHGGTRTVQAVLAIPKIVTGGLVLLAIGVMLYGVFMRYVMLPITDWLDVDPINFFWVEEVGETTLAWLTLIGAAVGVAERSHFTLTVVVHRFPQRVQHAIHVGNNLLIAAFGGLVAWVGVKLAILNATLTSPALEFSLAWLYAAATVGGILMALYALRAAANPAEPEHDILDVRNSVLLAATVVVFVGLLLLSLPIVFCLGAAGVTGLWLGGYPMQQLGSTMIASSQSWVLLAIPSFVFAGSLMERAGMSNSLVELARAMVGWLRGGLGMSVIVVSYFFSDICGSKMAEVSALSSALMPSLRRAGYRPADAASLISSGTAMGMLVPPAIFMIVISAVTNQSAVALFLAGFIPAAVIGLCLCVLVLIQAHLLGWPKDTDTSWHRLLYAAKDAAVPMVIPVVILGGFYFGAFTATEAGAIVALYSLLAARFYYRNVSWMQVLHIAYDSGVLTGVVIFLLAVATIFQYLMGLSGVPELLGRLLQPLQSQQWLFLTGVATMTMLFGMLLEGLPAAVVLIPVVFPVATRIGIHPVHFDIVQTAAVGIGLFMPPMGVGLLMALRFARVPVFQHAKSYWPYLVALIIGLMLIICIPELSLFLPRSAGMIK